MLPPPCGLVTLLTDFGLSDPYVGIMHGMVKREHRRAEIVDLCHAVPPQAIGVGALFLRAAVDRFPPGTIHVAVVDPGVGTARRLIGVAAHRCYWLAPDNGLLTGIFAGAAEVRELSLSAMDVDARGAMGAMDAMGATGATGAMDATGATGATDAMGGMGATGATSATFHGRDIFAPVAGRLSSGRYGFRSIGPRIDDPVRIEAPARTGHRVIHVDHFGNLITDVTRTVLQQAVAVAVRVGDREVPIRRTYGEMARGEALALINSYDLLEIAICGGDARRRLGIDVDASVVLVGVAATQAPVAGGGARDGA
jgi:hypothetical protein